MPADDGALRGAGDTPRHYEVLLAQGKQLAANHPRQTGPADHGEDDHDAEVDPHRRPVARQCRRQRHPQRNGGNRDKQVHQPLDHRIHGTAQVARQPAQSHAEHEGEEDPHQPDRKRDAGPVQNAAEHVAAEAFGPEQQHRPIIRPEQVDVALEQPP